MVPGQVNGMACLARSRDEGVVPLYETNAPHSKVEQRSACRAHNPEDGGSNPSLATNMEAIIQVMPKTGDIEIDTYNEWKALGFPRLDVMAKICGVSASQVSMYITRALAKIKHLNAYAKKETALIFVKHKPTGMFCAALETMNDLRIFLAAREDKVSDFVWYTRDKVKSCTGFDVNRIHIHTEYAV